MRHVRGSVEASAGKRSELVLHLLSFLPPGNALVEYQGEPLRSGVRDSYEFLPEQIGC